MKFPSAAFDRWKTTPPEEEEPITTDWRGGYVEKGDLIYVIEGNVVMKDDLEEYIETVYGGAEEA